MAQNRILAWNCRGLGESSAISKLKELCFQQKPSLIFLSETKRTASEMNLIRLELGFNKCFAVDCVGRGGGLALIWTDDFQLAVSSFSQSHIDVEIVDPGGNQWRLTGFYGRPETACRAVLQPTALAVLPTNVNPIGEVSVVLPTVLEAQLIEVPLYHDLHSVKESNGKGIAGKGSRGRWKRMERDTDPLQHTGKTIQCKRKSGDALLKEERACKVVVDNTGVALVQMTKGYDPSTG